MAEEERVVHADAVGVRDRSPDDPEQLGAERLDAWARTAAATDTLIEVNEKWACPGPLAIAAARAAGARLVASTDSHAASDVGRYDRVVALLDEGAP